MEFSQLIQSRRSVRAYQDAPIPKEALLELADAARMAPSWKNTQTARTYIASSPEMVSAVRAALPAFNQDSTAKASAYLVTGFVPGLSGYGAKGPSNELGDAWGAYDLGLHDAYLILKAADLGLDTLIMGLRDEQALRTALSIPAEVQIFSVIALGKRDGEPVFRPRKPLE